MAASEITPKALQPKVYIGTSMSSMTYNATVLCDSLNMKIAPGYSQAVLSHKYGRLAIAPETRFKEIESLDLSGKLVKLTSVNDAGSESTLFIGVIANNTDAPMGTVKYGTLEIPTGNNYYVAYGLDFLLDRITVNVSYVKFTSNAEPVDSIFEFNGSSSAMIKNRSSAKSMNSYYFDFVNTPLQWTGLDIVEYLLDRFAHYSGLAWQLSGDYTYLRHITVSLDPRGKSVRQCLNEIIKPEFGFSYLLQYSTGSNTVYLSVISISDVDITYDGAKIIPANGNTKSLGQVLEYDRTVSNARLAKVEQSAYDYIKVSSEPVRVMATFNFGENGLDKAWSDENETTYKSADDVARQKETIEDVYQKFSIKKDWDKTDYFGNEIIPAVDDETLEVTFTGGMFIPGVHVFDRTLPIPKKTTNPNADFKMPILLVKNADDEFRLADKTAFDGEDEAPGIGFRVLDDGLSVMLKAPYNHIVAKGHFGTLKSEYEPIYDYEDMQITLSFYSDAVLKYKIAGVSTGGTITRVKEIYIPGFHYWVAAPGTKIDTDQSTGGSAVVYRDDREQLKKIAYLAKAWYGRLRNTLSFDIGNINNNNWLGSMITNAYSGGSFTPIGTIVTALNYNFMNQSTSISTDFTDLDFTRLSRRQFASSMRNVTRRISEMEEQIVALPLRDSRGGGGGAASYDGPFAVVKSTNDSGGEILKLLGYNHTEGRHWRNFVKINYEHEVDETELELPSSTLAWVILEITFDKSLGYYKIEVKVHNNSSTPAPTNEKIIIPIAFIEMGVWQPDIGKITQITQYQYGGITIMGRVI